MHVLLIPDIPTDNADRLLVEGDEARHAIRVKRVRRGEQVVVLDGKGTLLRCLAEPAGRDLELVIQETEHAEPVRPAVHVCSATPKGARVEQLVDSLVQVGAASWTPMLTKLGVVDPRENKLDRLQRIASEALKQARRPYAMELRPKSPLGDVISGGGDAELVIAHSGGSEYRASGAPEIRVLIGPEGGFLPEEIDAAARAGAQIVTFGPHTMRIEAAGPAAVTTVLAAERCNDNNSHRENTA